MADEAKPAVGFSLTANLYGERNVVFQTHLPLDMLLDKPEAADALILSVCRQVDRLKARYAIQEVEADIRADTAMRAQQQRGREEADAALTAALTALDQRAATLLEAAIGAEASETLAWAESGRLGKYKPTAGSPAARSRAEAEKLKGEKTQKRSEHQQHVANIDMTLKQYDIMIAAKGVELDRLRSIAEA